MSVWSCTKNDDEKKSESHKTWNEVKDGGNEQHENKKMQ